jgi:hypothetical protein
MNPRPTAPACSALSIAGGESTAYRSGLATLSDNHSSATAFSLVVLAFPFFIWALEVFDAVFVEDPETRGYFVD